MKNPETVRVGDATPWGEAQHVDAQETPGVLFVSTASHGGYYVPPALRAKIPAPLREYAAMWSHGWGDGWYEEDVAAIAVLAYVLEREAGRAALPALLRYTGIELAEVAR